MPDSPTIQAVPIDAADLPVIEQVLETFRPRLRADGGDLHLVSVEGDKITLHLSGNCMGCLQAGETLGIIRRHLMQALGKALRVVPALPG